MMPALLTALLSMLAAAAARPRPMPRGRRGRTPQATPAVPSGRRPRFGRGSRAFRRARVDPGELATWCDSLARAVRGGSSLRNAVLDVVAPDSVGAAVERIVLALRRGVPLAESFGHADHVSPHLDLVLVMLRTCATHGGAAAEPIDRTAAALRQRQALDAERRTNSAQARMSALVMTLVPVAMLTLLLTTSAGVRNSVMSPIGMAAIVLGSVFNAAGWLWMKRMIAVPT